MTLNQEIAVGIKRLRLEKGVTQKELARRINSKQPVISRLESLDNPTGITVAMIEKIAAALGVKPQIRWRAK